MEQAMPRMTIMVGLPRAGKTTYVQSNKGNAVVVSGDELRYLVYGQRFWADGESLMWSIRDIILRMLLQQGKDIIIDETNMTVKRRKPIIELAKKYGYEVVAMHINTLKEVCMQRAINTNDEIIKPVIERMEKEFEPLTYDEGFDMIITRKC